MPDTPPHPPAPPIEAAAAPAPQPLTPRKGLFVALCVVFGVWVAFLATLYFTTVYGKQDPHAHVQDATDPPADAASPAR